jgi:hypothetical protein
MFWFHLQDFCFWFIYYIWLFQVKVIVNLKGRENEFRNNAIELLRRFQNDVGEVLMMYFYLFMLKIIYKVQEDWYAIYSETPNVWMNASAVEFFILFHSM